MLKPTQTSIPTLVRVKEGALHRTGLYLKRDNRANVVVLLSKGLVAPLPREIDASLRSQGITPFSTIEIEENSLERATNLFAKLPSTVDAVIGVGGGRAIDVAKYVAFLGRWPFYAIPTSLSNDGFCSPQSSLTVDGKRRSLPAALPYGVIIDTSVCLAAPRILTQSGVGDLVAKFTAVQDWKLAYHQTGEPIHDFSVLLSDSSIHAFMSHPDLDIEGIRLLAVSLMLNGIAMEVCGSSRPASGSEHLISHALDAISVRPRLHGLQVGIAAYLASQLHEKNTELIAQIFDQTGFWKAVSDDPFSREEWLRAVKVAPSIKPGYYTVLSSAGMFTKVKSILHDDPRLQACFY
jgi:glycerol-1-phosphate dehydrogenase [NAD(P)+]